MRAWIALGLSVCLSACGAAPDEATSPPDAAVDRAEPADVMVEDVAVALDDVAPPDAAVAVPADAAVDARPPPPDAPRIVAPDGRWTWVDVPGAVCANGQPTGFGVNLRPGARDVLIFLQGGGACWDGLTCWGPVATSFYVATGYNRLAFETDVLRTAMLLLRREAANPFQDFNLIYVPYCTGDVHAGNRVATYDFFGPRATYHMGAHNLALFLPRIAATFPDARRVFLAGDSAGGFGVAVNLPRVQATFPDVRVGVVDDSGPPIQPAGDRWSTWVRNWGVELPAGCPACASSIDVVLDSYRTNYPDNPVAVLSYANDSIISTFMGLSSGDFRARLYGLADRSDRTWPGARYFITDGISHVLQAQPIRPRGLDDWLRRFVAGDPTLRSVRP